MNTTSEFGENPIIRSQVIWYTNKEIDKQTAKQTGQPDQSNQIHKLLSGGNYCVLNNSYQSVI